MSKKKEAMKRSRCLVSEETLISQVIESGIHFHEGSDGDGSLDDDLSLSDEQSTNDMVDDTDEDPTWSLNPSSRFSFTPRRPFSIGLDQPGPSGISDQPGPSGITSTNLVIEATDQSSSDEEPVPHNPRPTRGRPTRLTQAA